MHSLPDLAPNRINDDLLRFSLRPPSWFMPAVVLLGLAVAAGFASIGLMIAFGLHFLGLTHVQQWSVLITHLVFWVGISHAGVMISAILRLTQAEWRRPITRAAEVLAIFALITAAMFPIIHSGRLWRTMYWVFPYDFSRDIWPNIRSALIWDVSAILTYLTGTILFVFVDLVPDLAVIRDRTAGWRHSLYGVLSLGFRGTARQWQIQRTAGSLLSALILPVFVSVHSTVAWDFGMAILPGWHTTILAPYFVIGAVHSGVAGVVTVMAVLRRALHLEQYLRREHFEVVGRIQLIVAFGWLFFFLSDFYFAIFAQRELELRIWELRLFTPPWNVLFAVMVLTVFLIPVPFWLFRRCRLSVPIMFWTSLSVNVGMWLERYILIVTPLSLKQPFVFTWVENYVPRPIEYVLSFAFLALVALGLLLFARMFPIVPIWDVKVGQILKRRVQVGRARVPAAIQE
jgi:molybdopterin-containing oxidoreductase family membrane subunit